MGLPRIRPATNETKEETTVGKKPEQETIDAIRKDASVGDMNFNQIAEKHGVGWSTVQKYAGADAGKPSKAKRMVRMVEGSISIKCSPALLDRVWNALTIEEKAQLLGRI